jgi:hypothetical protein
VQRCAEVRRGAQRCTGVCIGVKICAVQRRAEVVCRGAHLVVVGAGRDSLLRVSAQQEQDDGGAACEGGAQRPRERRERDDCADADHSVVHLCAQELHAQQKRGLERHPRLHSARRLLSYGREQRTRRRQATHRERSRWYLVGRDRLQNEDPDRCLHHRPHGVGMRKLMSETRAIRKDKISDKMIR